MTVRTRTAGLLILLLTVLILPTDATFVAAQRTFVDPDTIVNPQAGPAGIYVFYDWSNLDPTLYPIVGGHLSVPWSTIEVGHNSYDWSAVERWINNEAALGKRVGLGFNTYDGQCCGGIGIPDYLKRKYPDISLTCQDDEGNSHEIPRYWNAEYKNALSQFIHVLGARYDGDPRVAWVETSVGIFGEAAPAEHDFDECLQAAGLTSQMWVDIVNWTTDTYKDAFPHTQLMLQYSGRFLNRSERRAFSAHAAGMGIGLKHNGLKPDGGADAIITDPELSSYQAGQYDPIIQWGQEVPAAFEGSDVNVSIQGRTKTMWGLYNALDKHVDYLSLDTNVVSAEDRQDLLTFAAQYLGRTLADTPSVWVALRETEYDWFPDWGNYEFWLYQNDEVPGGKTVPLWNVGTAPEGRYTRRTDGATGNASMYFDIDNRYAYGGTNLATITVTYYDQGTDHWELRYDSLDDNDKLGGIVQKTDTHTWQTATFVLDDAEFADGQPGGGTHAGSDFRIWNGDDGDELIHLVDVAVQPGVPKTLTLQPGVDGYQGLTDTYLNAWSPGDNFGNEHRFLVRSRDFMFGLMKFDLSALPTTSRVTTATLQVYQYNRSNPAPITLAAHRVLRPWDEGAATWEQATANVAWQEPGASGSQDRSPTPVDDVDVDRDAGWVSLDVTSLVQEWVTHPTDNHGLLLRGTASSAVEYRFASAEWPEIAARPRLIIGYLEHGATTPTPTPSPTPSSTPRTLISRQTINPPAIDGDLSEWTQPEQVILNADTAAYLEGQPDPSAADSSAQVLSLWDDQWLYFAARVSDDQLYRDSDQIWHDDSIELALDGANDQVSGNPDDHQFTVASDGTLKEFGIYDVPGARVAVQRRAGGYDVELALPVNILAAGDPSEGKTMGFNIGLIDDDDGGKREGTTTDSYMIWAGHSTYNDAADYGKLILGAPYELPTPDPSPTPSATPTQTATPTPTVTGTFTPSPTASVTPTPTATPTWAPSPTATDTSTPTPTWTSSPTATDTSTPTPSATPTQTPTPTVTPTATPDTGNVGGLVFYDQNGNSWWDEGEPGLAGAVLALKQGGTEIHTATSDTDGVYIFTDVKPGQYTLQEKVPPPGYQLNSIPIVLEIQANKSLPDVNIGQRPASTSTPTPTQTMTVMPTNTPTASATPRQIYVRYFPLLIY